MQPSFIEEKIYNTLISDNNLINKLGSGIDSIFHLQAPELNELNYPCIVYSLSSFKPFFWADDVVWSFEIKFRLHVITLNGNDDLIEKDIERIANDILSASRFYRTSFKHNKEVILILDYLMRVNEKPPNISNDTNNTINNSDSNSCPCCSSTTTKINLMSKDKVNDIFAKWESEDF